MIPAKFEYHRPTSVQDAVALLAQLGEEARPLAGGHSLIPVMKTRLAAPEHLVDLAGISSLKGIRREQDHIAIGAMATQSEMIASPLLAEILPIIRETSLLIGDPQIRYVGTIGGNVANGDPGNDMPALMMCLDAEYQLAGRNGQRRVRARAFYLGAYDTARQNDEILTEVRIPIPAKGHGYAYEKLKRKVGDYAVAAAAVMLTITNGTCRAASIGLTNVADTPLWAEAAARALIGTGIDRTAVANAANAAKAITNPASDGPGRISQENDRRDGPACDRTRQIARGSLREHRAEKKMSKVQVKMTINGREVEALVEPRTLLVHFLREQLGLTGTHIGCDTSHCGACTVDLNEMSVKSCALFAVQANGAAILTIEGMAAPDGTLHALQEGFRQMHGLQCGYCTPGMIMRAHRLLKENPNPSEDEIRSGISGNLCRCTGYQNIVKSIQYAAAKINGVPYQEAAE